MTAPYVPGPEEAAPPPPAAEPQRRSRKGLTVALAVVGVAILVGLTVAITLAATSTADPPAASNVADSKGEPFTLPTGVTTAPTVAPEPTPTTGPTPAIADFKLTPKILDKECFGSAGCNITYRVDVNYSGPALSESDTWLITYEVNGIEDAPGVGSLELTGTTYESSEDTVSTTSSKKKVTLKVTSVDKDGI